ncbi:MAG TPA: hypothetical protein VN461_17760 [Vicinamibacteria bacterium]|jgi:hypothetical protein|nr:hypothetical protein [Vicinamibacteria bacterium]
MTAIGGRRVLAALLVLGGLFPPPGAEAGTRLASGEWGGQHVRMSVGETGALLEFDCAHGSIGEAMVLDERGRFEAKGRFVREHGGPTRKDEAEGGAPALYRGSSEGTNLVLEIALEEGPSLGPFHLTLGGRARLVKCR